MSLQKKYPDVKICDSHNCPLTIKEHELFYADEQRDADMAKRGMIRVIYTAPSVKEIEMERTHQWWNGKEWITL